MNVISQEAFAKIAVNKSLLKEYNSSKYSRVVYLNDGDEFQIQLFNSEKHIIAAKIFIDGEELNDMLVLRPGERIWLERYLDRARKFKFSTYEIEDSAEAKEAASLNGQVKVCFYRVKTPRKNPIVFVNNVSDYYYPTYKNFNSPSVYTSSVSLGPNTALTSNAEACDMSYVSSVSCDNLSFSVSACTQDSCEFVAANSCASAEPTRSMDATIETGRTEEGRSL